MPYLNVMFCFGRLILRSYNSHDLGFILFNLFMFVHHFGCFVLQCMIIFAAELKRSLYALCSQYGRILDVVALKTQKLRGQAWVVFSEITAATNAFRGLQDFDFYGKIMVLHVHFSRKPFSFLLSCHAVHVMRCTIDMLSSYSLILSFSFYAEYINIVL